MSLDPTLAWTIRLVAASLLVTAGASKLAALEPFLGVVRNYRLLPASLVRPFAYGLPVVEIAVALALLAVPLGSARLPALAAALLLGLFAAAMAINLRRGRSDIDCGCFAGLMRQKLSWALVARNLVLMAALLLVAVLPATERAFGWLDVVTLAAGAGTLLLAWAVVGQLFGRAPRALAEAG